MKNKKPDLKRILRASKELSNDLNKLKFPQEIFTYNTYEYAWDAHVEYFEKFLNSPIKALLLGMNPGPYGMLQSGIPFGDISKVKNYLKITKGVSIPKIQHPQRPILGFESTRNEISGSRLWGLIENKFKESELFFKDYFVLNYCPLGFLNLKGANLTPDKIPLAIRKSVELLCDKHLTTLIESIECSMGIGIGAYAAKALKRSWKNHNNIHTLLHPSPASPAANKNWELTALKQLKSFGLF